MQYLHLIVLTLFFTACTAGRAQVHGSFPASENKPDADKIKLYLTSHGEGLMNALIPLLPAFPKEKTVGYITTAGYNAPWVQENITRVEASGFNIKSIDLAELSPADLDLAFSDCDIIWVGGGNTFYLLQEVRRSGFDTFITNKIYDGVPYVGSSAGSIIIGPNIELVKFADDPREGSDLSSYDGLNIFPLVPLAHYDHPDYKDIYKQILNFGLEHDIPLVSLKENQIVFVEGTRWQIINAHE